MLFLFCICVRASMCACVHECLYRNALVSLRVTPRQNRASVSHHSHPCSHPSPNLECCTREQEGKKGKSRDFQERASKPRNLTCFCLASTMLVVLPHMEQRAFTARASVQFNVFFGIVNTCIHAPRQFPLHVGGTREHAFNMIVGLANRNSTHKPEETRKHLHTRT